MALSLAIRAHCWDAGRGLFADDADRQVFSQHMNVFAVLYDIATPAERAGILERVTVPGKGIDAPPGMYASSYYFAWYLVRAFEHAGWQRANHTAHRPGDEAGGHVLGTNAEPLGSVQRVPRGERLKRHLHQ